MPGFRELGARFEWGYARDEFLRRHPPLRERDDVTVTALAARATTGPRHVLYRSFDALPYLRDTMRLHRYTF